MTDDIPGDDESRPHESVQNVPATYTIDPDETHSVAVVRAVASFRDVSTTDLTPLYDAIDPDHLDGLFDERTPDGHPRNRSVSFVFDECYVTVTADTVRVQAASTDTA